MKKNLKDIQHSGVIRHNIPQNAEEYKKIYINKSEVEKFFALCKNVWVEDFCYEDKVFVRYFVYVHIDNIIGNCL
jgi:hypothetical protein